MAAVAAGYVPPRAGYVPPSRSRRVPRPGGLSLDLLWRARDCGNGTVEFVVAAAEAFIQWPRLRWLQE